MSVVCYSTTFRALPYRSAHILHWPAHRACVQGARDMEPRSTISLAIPEQSLMSDWIVVPHDLLDEVLGIDT
jgi:hypothetical protein